MAKKKQRTRTRIECAEKLEFNWTDDLVEGRWPTNWYLYMEHPCVLLQWLNKTVTTAFQNRHSGNNEPKHEFYQIRINQHIVVILRFEWCPLGFKIKEVFTSFRLMQLSICSSNLVYRILLDSDIWNRCSSHKFCFFAFDYLALLVNWPIGQH